MIFRYLNAKFYEREVFLLSDELTQWHPAFCSALRLELSENREDLKELNEDHHIWLSSLTQTISKSKAEKLLYTAADLYRKDDKEFAESVLQVAMNKNKNIFGKIKEETEMCEALRELMKPEIDAEVDKRIKKIVADKLAEKDSILAEKDSTIAEKDSTIAEKDSTIAEKDSALAEKEEEIKALKAKLVAAGIY